MNHAENVQITPAVRKISRCFLKTLLRQEKVSATADRDARDKFHLCHHHDRDHHCIPRVWWAPGPAADSP